MMPLAIDLFCGLGGWTDGLLAEGYDVIGFDITQHVYGEHRYPGKLVIQDVTTLYGSQFRTADLIVASPPCQFFSYCAMPWSRAKELAAKTRADPALLEKELALFNACFRIQREACEAAGHHIPMVVENVRGAIPWVGRSRWAFGSFHLWGDVPALMPMTIKGSKQMGKAGPDDRPDNRVGLGSWRERLIKNSGGQKVPGFCFDGSGKSFQSASVEHVKVPSEEGRRTDPGKGARFTSRDCGVEGGIKQGGDWFNASQPSMSRLYGSKSPQRKMASAMIAKIPLPLSRYIAATFRPQTAQAAAQIAQAAE